MKILVTGGAGFIGSHLVPLLRDHGHEVRILDTLSPQIHGEVPQGLDWMARTGAEFLRGSVTSAADIEKALDGMEAVVHLASETGTGQSMYEIARYTDANVQGTALLMDRLAAGGHGVTRVLLASSRSVYGEGAYIRRDTTDGPDGPRITPPARSAEALRARQWDPVCPETGAPLTAVPTREDDRTAPSSIYAATKLMQEDLVRISCDTLGIGYAILRLQNVYGEGQSLNNPYTGILSIFSTRIRRGLQLPIFEDGAESRDFVHVSDVAAAFAAAAERADPANAVINVGSGRATSVREVAESLSRAFGAEPDLTVTGQYRLGDIRHNMADVSRLKEILGLTPAVSLDEGLGRFAGWVGTQPLPEDQLEKANAELAKRKMMG
ncbi:epimerase [Oceanicola sp. 22II-s10i]|uniref:NAD-dependent epimerase/dehydratase family protein n=1 Tax=Oceanicola sp. 22II-s10i TaxID=1317116 RepID=UPI000B5219BC|nr:NAD-dependent epimerase/dehydratase family protein [Oceanicola sp. 22II-s10i]OWU82250.1 epimerase [Oceanicola sp. 22II-s10i]